MTDKEALQQLQSGLIGLRTGLDGLIAVANAQLMKPVDPVKPVDPPKPPPANVSPLVLGGPSARHEWRGPQGASPSGVFSVRLPNASGSISHTRNVFTDGGVSVKWAISKTPGDMEWWKTQTVPYWGSVTHPYGGVFGAESGGLNWGPSEISGGRVYAKVDSGEWYLNLEVSGPINPDVGCLILDIAWK